MSEKENKKNKSGYEESVLERFISQLSSEERQLVGEYLKSPNPQVLSKSFDAIVETKTAYENKVD